MNQEYNNQNSFNTQNNDEVSNNQQLQNNQINNNSNEVNANFNQINPNIYQQPAQPQQFTPQNNNNHLKKKIIVVVVAIIFAVGLGCSLYYLNPNNNISKKNDKNGTVDKKTDEKNNKEPEYYTFNKYKGDDNIAFTFQTTGGYYAIDLTGEKFGADLTKSYERKKVYFMGERLNKDTSVFKNDGLSISHYYNISIGSVILHDIWNCEFFKITVDDNSGLPESSGKYVYEVIDSKENYYLVSNSSEGYEPSYSVYIVMPNKDYRFHLNFSYETLDDAKNMFNKIVENIKVAFIKLNDKYEIVGSYSFKDEVNTMDISKWRFFSDLIFEYYSNRGLNLASSVQIDDFNHENGGEVFSKQIYLHNKQDYVVGLTLYNMDEDRFLKNTDMSKKNEKFSTVPDDLEKIKLDNVKEAYMHSSNKDVSLYVKTFKDKYFYIETGIPYNDDEQKKKEIISELNLLFK